MPRPKAKVERRQEFVNTPAGMVGYESRRSTGLDGLIAKLIGPSDDWYNNRNKSLALRAAARRYAASQSQKQTRPANSKRTRGD